MSRGFHLAPWLRDWGAARSIEYVAVLHEERAELLRISGRNRLTAVLHVEAEESPEATARTFFTRLKHLPEYYGQPFAVFISNSKAFIYVRRMAGTDPAMLRQRLQLLADEQTEFKWSIEHICGEEYFFGQGIDKFYHACLQQQIETLHLPVSGLGTLAAQLSVNAMTPPGNTPRMHLQHWPDGSADYALFDGRSSLISGQLDPASSESHVLATRRILTACLGDAAGKAGISQSVCKSPTAGMQRQGRTEHAPSALCRSTLLPYCFRSSATAAWIQRALNVGRLLTAVLGSIMMVAALIALALGTGAGDTTGGVRRYQSRYAEKLELESRITALRHEQTEIARSQPEETQAAACVSLFCQERVPGAYLTRLSVRQWAGDSTTVDARGTAQRESQIFDYVAALNTILAPRCFTIGSITPEVVASMGQPDTVQTFRLSLVMHEQNAAR